MRGTRARNTIPGKQPAQGSRKATEGRAGRILRRVGRQYAIRLLFEQLEERRVLSTGEWLVRLDNLGGETRDEQMQAASERFQAAGIIDGDIQVVDNVGVPDVVVVEVNPDI